MKITDDTIEYPHSTRILSRKVYYKGDMLMRQGEFGNACYFIESGGVEVYAHDNHGHKISLSHLGKGSVVGEMAVITQQPRSANVVVTEESVIVQITAHDFNEKVKDTELVFQAVLKLLIERLKHANNHILETGAALEALEEKVGLTIHNISKKVPEEKQKQFQHDVMPRLEALLAVLKKYK